MQRLALMFPILKVDDSSPGLQTEYNHKFLGSSVISSGHQIYFIRNISVTIHNQPTIFHLVLRSSAFGRET
jgi:hypothetical protein